jgi:hypothetical protein
MSRIFTSAAVLVLAAVAGTTAGQLPASISGVLTDTTGRALPGATVAVRSSDIDRRAVTDSDGRYRVDGLATAGRYTVEASMAGFDTKVATVTVRPDAQAVWSGALLTGPAFGESSIEREVLHVTGIDAVDCGRHAGSASQAGMRRSLACGLASVRAGRPFSIVVQFPTGAANGSHGVLSGSDNVVYLFEHKGREMRLRLQQCPFSQVTLAPRGSGAGFEFRCAPRL